MKVCAMRPNFAFAALYLLNGHVSLAAPSAKAQNLTVDLGYEVYRGAYDSTAQLDIWRGIRYAAPPIGDLRWRAPAAPIASENGVVDAIEFAPGCPQAAPVPFPAIPGISGSEDCLFLNVYAPRSKKKTKLPVLVWIHGGGYGFGNGQQDMREIIKANDNKFVAVSIQYRLGAFGFLSSAEVEQNGALNTGILDMAFALQWVQNHIDQFGGDKSQVTVSGQSAGAGGVMQLAIAKNGTLKTSLFKNIVVASPFLPPQYKFDGSIPTRQYKSFASYAGCANATDVLSCLRSKDTLTLQNANSNTNAANFYGNWAFAPVVEPNTGYVTTHPSNALTAKRVNGEHILVGNNANEGPLLVPTINSTEAFHTWLEGNFPLLTLAELDAILAAYPASELPIKINDAFATSGFGPVTALDVSSFATGMQQRANNIFAEATFVCPSYWLNDAFTTQKRKSFHYQYSVVGALHGSDVSAYFGPATPSQPPPFTDALRQIWGGFVTVADPTTAKGLKDLKWPVWKQDGRSQMINLNTTGGVPYSALQLTGMNLTEYMEPGLRNRFSLVNALQWEGDRGARCELWRNITSRVLV
ncbi:carboxylesterase type B [Boeremia exigua]|uniref:carboxylesterase type B n=1 Tax=Boeremia exigua TaxID=749465 RepID=UPI001E8CD056|nr:carboxylesterase type B [Boeremia exigua]KAH6625571.1 carboxylesterase type B [Boeremia exigua]